jgi:hypothetical protein
LDALLAIVTSAVGAAIGGIALLLLAGWYLLWRSRRKLRQTT